MDFMVAVRATTAGDKPLETKQRNPLPRLCVGNTCTMEQHAASGIPNNSAPLPSAAHGSGAAFLTQLGFNRQQSFFFVVLRKVRICVVEEEEQAIVGIFAFGLACNISCGPPEARVWVAAVGCGEWVVSGWTGLRVF